MTETQTAAKHHVVLVAKVASDRDKEAFAELFDFYAPRILGSLVRMRVERATAEEVTQDVMATLWRKAGLFDPVKSSLATWLFRIARNRRIDLLRRSRVDFCDPFDFSLDMVADAAPSVEHLIDAGQREDVLREVMKTLPQEQMALVRLAFYDAMTHAEIAAQTGLPLGTVKSRLRLAFSRLRRGLEAAGILSTT